MIVGENVQNHIWCYLFYSIKQLPSVMPKKTNVHLGSIEFAVVFELYQIPLNIDLFAWYQ